MLRVLKKKRRRRYGGGISTSITSIRERCPREKNRRLLNKWLGLVLTNLRTMFLKRGRLSLLEMSMLEILNGETLRWDEGPLSLIERVSKCQRGVLMDLAITKAKTSCQGCNRGGFIGRKRLINILLSQVTISNIRIRKVIKKRSQ